MSPPANLRVNDVYTPEVTRLLGERLDAGWIINEDTDRNHLDLNRATQVLRRAPWFLDLLVGQIEAILARHGVAEVLFIHGWNVGQAKCDLGIGAIEASGTTRIPDGARMTVSEGYRRQRLELLRRVAARQHVEVSFGIHYPASHQNNLLQLFTAHDRHPDVANVGKIAAWVRAGTLNAVQLELGIPLRWPGRWRDAWLAIVAEVFGGRSGRLPASARIDPRTSAKKTSVGEAGPDAPCPTPVETGVRQTGALQFYDPKADLAVLSGVGPMAPGVLGGRLLLFLGGQRVALFTGEDAASQKRGVAPLQLHDDGQKTRLEFDGPLLLMDDAATYLDLEAAFADSRLAEVRARLVFDGAAGAAQPMRFGRVSGTLEIDGDRRDLDCLGFANVPTLRMAAPQPYTTLSAIFESGRAMLSRHTHGDGPAASWYFQPPAQERTVSGELHTRVEEDGYTPREIEWRSREGKVACARPMSRMAILRNLMQGYQRVSFGVARFECDGETGFGLYEYAVPLGAVGGRR